MLSDAYFYIGLAYEYKKCTEDNSAISKYSTAIEYYKKAIKEDLKCRYCDYIYYRIGKCWYEKYSYNKEKECLDSAIINFNRTLENPMSRDYSFLVYSDMGNCYYDKGNIDRALENYNKAIDNNPDYAEAYNLKGDLYFNRGDYKSAIDSYNEAVYLFLNHIIYTSNIAYNIQTTKTYPFPYYYGIGDAYFNDKKYDKAIEYYNRAFEYFDICYKYGADSLYYFLRIGDAYHNKRDYSNAVESYKEAIRLVSDSSDYFPIYLSIGKSYFHNYNYNDALDYFNKAIDKDSTDVVLCGYLGDTYNNVSKYEDAIYWYTKLVNKTPDDVQVYGPLGNAYYNMQKYEDAIYWYKKLVDKNYADVYKRIGNAYYNMRNKYDETINYLLIATKKDSTDKMTYSWLGNTYYYMQKYEEAINCYQKAIEIYPDGYTYFQLGNTYLQKANYDKTIECFKKATYHYTYYNYNKIETDTTNNNIYSYYTIDGFVRSIISFIKSCENYNNYTYKVSASDCDEAIKYIEKSLLPKNMKNANAEVYYLIGLVYLRKNTFDRIYPNNNAIENFQNAAKLGNEQAQLWLKDNDITW